MLSVPGWWQTVQVLFGCIPPPWLCAGDEIDIDTDRASWKMATAADFTARMGLPVVDQCCLAAQSLGGTSIEAGIVVVANDAVPEVFVSIHLGKGDRTVAPAADAIAPFRIDSDGAVNSVEEDRRVRIVILHELPAVGFNRVGLKLIKPYGAVAYDAGLDVAAALCVTTGRSLPVRAVALFAGRRGDELTLGIKRCRWVAPQQLQER